MHPLQNTNSNTLGCETVELSSQAFCMDTEMGVSAAECPLHYAMAHLADAAVTQHVLYAYGEFVPRQELVQSIHAWSGLHDLVRTRVCPAMRIAEPNQGGVFAQAECLLASLTVPLSASAHADLLGALAACATRGPGEGCPLEREPEISLLGDSGQHRQA